MAQTVFRCPASMPTDLIAAWHDHTLNADQAANVNAHVASCPACQSYLSEYAQDDTALRRAEAPALQERIWRGVRADIAQSPQRRAGLPHNAVLGGLGAALAVTLLFAAVFVFVLDNKGSTRSISVVPTATSILLPTATATITTTPMITSIQAWGQASDVARSLSQTKTNADDVFPDAYTYVGEASDNQSLTVNAVGTTVNRLYIAPADVGSFDIRTDGHYIAWLSPKGDLYTGGPGPRHQIVGYMNIETNQTKILVDATQRFNAAPGAIAVDHGIFLWALWNAGVPNLNATDMATGITTTIAHDLSTSYLNDIHFSWPYILYHDSASREHFYNLQGNSDSIMSQIPPLPPSTPTQQSLDYSSFAIAGTTVFWLHAITSDNAVFAVEEIDHANQANAPTRRVATMRMAVGPNFDRPINPSANERLLVWSEQAGIFAWDRVEHVLIHLSPSPYFTGFPAVIVHGNNLIYTTGADEASMTYHIIDTTKLPATAP